MTRLSVHSSPPVDITFIDDDYEYPLTYHIIGAWFEPGSHGRHGEAPYPPEYDYKCVYLEGDTAQTDLSAALFERVMREIETYFADADLYL